MVLNPNRTSADFTFKHTGQPDKFGASKGGVVADVQADLDQRAIDNLEDINNVKDHIRSDLATKTELATAVFTSVVPDGSITSDLLSDDPTEIKAVVAGHTAELALTYKRMPNNSKLPTDTPSTYPIGTTAFFDLANAWVSSVGINYPIIETMRYYNGSNSCYQVAYPYLDADGIMVKARRGLATTNTWSEWKPTSPISGTYTGDGTASRTIPLGFTPSAVFVINNNGQLTESGVSSYGGLALTGSPAKYSSGNVVTITTGGFIVYGDSPNDIFSNGNGVIMHYIALP